VSILTATMYNGVSYPVGLSCPPTNNIKAIIYTSPTKLSVVQGASELLSLDLQNFFIPVENAQKTSFVLPAHSHAYLPFDLTTFNYCGMDASSSAKFAALFPEYPTGASSDKQYIEWVFTGDLSGPLNSEYPIQVYGATGASFSTRATNHIINIPGVAVGFTGVTNLISTDGGLKISSVVSGTKLLSTYNSEIVSNKINCSFYDTLSRIWIGSDKGLMQMSHDNSKFSFVNWNISNSSISSDNVYDISVFGDNVALATDNGISVYNAIDKKWKSYNAFNVNEITTNTFNKIFINETYIIGASNQGLFIYDIDANSWTHYDDNSPGWIGSEVVSALDVNTSEIFIGTSNNIMTMTIGGATMTPITGASAMSVKSIHYYPGATSIGKISVGYNNQISRYDIDSNSWDFNYSLGSVQLDFLSEDWLFCNDNGYYLFDYNALSYSKLPSATENADILLAFPNDLDYNLGLSQSIFLAFSKPVSMSTFNTHFSMGTASGYTGINVSLVSHFGGEVIEVIPSSLQKSTGYSYKVLNGLTANDSTYFRQTVNSTFYTENIEPVNGWKTIGKQLTLSGAENNLIPSITLRNPQSFDVTINVLAGI
jgi:hypothetical protein